MCRRPGALMTIPRILAALGPPLSHLAPIQSLLPRTSMVFGLPRACLSLRGGTNDGANTNSKNILQNFMTGFSIETSPKTSLKVANHSAYLPAGYDN